MSERDLQPEDRPVAGRSRDELVSVVAPGDGELPQVGAPRGHGRQVLRVERGRVLDGDAPRPAVEEGESAVQLRVVQTGVSWWGVSHFKCKYRMTHLIKKKSR